MARELYLNKSVLKKKERKFEEFSISQNNHSRGKPKTYTFTALQPGSRYAHARLASGPLHRLSPLSWMLYPASAQTIPVVTD